MGKLITIRGRAEQLTCFSSPRFSCGNWNAYSSQKLDFLLACTQAATCLICTSLHMHYTVFLVLMVLPSIVGSSVINNGYTSLDLAAAAALLDLQNCPLPFLHLSYSYSPLSQCFFLHFWGKWVHCQPTSRPGGAKEGQGFLFRH